jgi:HKD family nuclease
MKSDEKIEFNIDGIPYEISITQYKMLNALATHKDAEYRIIVKKNDGTETKGYLTDCEFYSQIYPYDETIPTIFKFVDSNKEYYIKFYEILSYHPEL